MSYNFDGKIVNQRPRFKFNSGNPKPTCSKCGKLIHSPEKLAVVSNIIQGATMFTAYSYVGTRYFIYETKSGSAVVYCSAYCRDKHNHRFQK